MYTITYPNIFALVDYLHKSLVKFQTHKRASLAVGSDVPYDENSRFPCELIVYDDTNITLDNHIAIPRSPNLIETDLLHCLRHPLVDLLELYL